MRGQTRLIKASLLALPIILLTVFFSVFISQDLLSSFERHMERSFFGVFGGLQVSSTPDFLARLHDDPALAKLDRSYRLSSKHVLLFQGHSRNVLKGVDVIAYDADYLQTKFDSSVDSPVVSTPTSSSSTGANVLDVSLFRTLYLSSVVYNQLGGKDNAVLAIFNPADERKVEFDKVEIVDFGFLGSQPVVVMSLADMQTLTKADIEFNQVEFSHVSKADIDNITQLSAQLMLAKVARNYVIINPQTLTHEARGVFGIVTVFKNVLVGFLLCVSIAILWLALKLLLASKRTSLQIIECIGINRTEIAATIVFLIIVVSFVTLLLGQQLSIMLANQLKLMMGIPLY